jgi:hypothetical protein
MSSISAMVVVMVRLSKYGFSLKFSETSSNYLSSIDCHSILNRLMEEVLLAETLHIACVTSL